MVLVHCCQVPCCERLRYIRLSRQPQQVSPMMGSCPAFMYEQLDTTRQCIRLVSIKQQLSPGGFIQCSIRQATIDAQYTCLSYRWGLPGLLHTILINGRQFHISQNLHDFLEVTRTCIGPDRLRSNYWIDAVCIDQRSETERNHQVAQMGKVYSSATRVIMWLGHTAKPRINETPIQSYLPFILTNEYWTRAWIMQEVILAQDAVLMVNNRLIPLSTLFNRIMPHPPLQRRPRSLEYIAAEVGIPKMLLAWQEARRDRRQGNRKSSLIHWLNISRDTKCKLPHDRVYSILELAAEGADITVDYTVPLVRLAFQVLEASKHKICLCEARFVNYKLQTHSEKLEPSTSCGYAEWDALPSGSVFIICEKIRLTRENTTRTESLKYGPGRSSKAGERTVRVPFQRLVSFWSAPPLSLIHI